LLNLYNKFYITLVVFLIASPALSLLGVVGLGYLPNEKIAILLVAINKNAWKPKFGQLRLFGLITSFFLIILFLVQLYLEAPGLFQAGINSILIMVSIPLYVSFFSHNPYLVYRAIFVVGIMQLCFSLIQQFYSHIGYTEIITFFNNYPPQKMYRYAVGETGFFYRTSGIFNESSSYAVFQWLAIISAIKINAHKRLFGKVILFILFIEVVLNGSIAGYLFAIGYFTFQYRPITKARIHRFFYVAIFVILSFLFLDVGEYFNAQGIYTKLLKQFDFLYDEMSNSPSRLAGMYRAIVYIFESDFLIQGVGFSWVHPSLDFYSLHLKAFGIVGFVVISVYILLILRKAPLNYKIGVLLVLSVNGHLSSAINILLLSLSVLFIKVRKRRDE
jgi:hypothetical protein